jgi:hypothetical protein
MLLTTSSAFLIVDSVAGVTPFLYQQDAKKYINTYPRKVLQHLKMNRRLSNGL